MIFQWISRAVSWLTNYEPASGRRWRIAPWWRIDPTRDQQRSLLRILNLAARERVAYGPLIGALADDHRGGYRHRLRKLERRLSSGTPLAESLEQTPGALGADAALAVRCGGQLGILPDAVAAVVHRDGMVMTRITDRWRRAVSYGVGFLLIAGLVVGFILVKIVPELTLVVSDFAAEPPWALRWLVAFNNAAGQFWVLLAVAGLAIGWLFYTQPGWRYFYGTWLPRLSRSAPRMRGADILNLLAASHRAGRPLPAVISTLARYHYDRRIRGQLLFVSNEVRQGVPLWDSMAAARLLTAAETDALHESPGGEADAWTMDRLAEVRRERVARHLETVLNLLHPLILLILAAGVTLVALAILLPLINLIEIQG